MKTPRMTDSPDIRPLGKERSPEPTSKGRMEISNCHSIFRPNR